MLPIVQTINAFLSDYVLVIMLLGTLLYRGQMYSLHENV